MNKLTYKHTLFACYLGYIGQAIVNNLPPLLFVLFQDSFNLSEGQLGSLIAINFCVQIGVDLLCAKFLDRIGYRIATVCAHIFGFIGILSLGFLPLLLPPDISYFALIFAMIIMAIGGGLTEVVISPIVEALPSDAKSSSMSLLHSFYSWGQVGVVAVTTAFFCIFPRTSWYWLTVFWSLVPLTGTLLFMFVPLRTLVEENERTPLKQLFGKYIFIVFLLLMLCAGASEMATSQWASFFAERGLNMDKAVGDLVGPCAFALTMAITRVYFGTRKNGYNIRKTLLVSSTLCVISYAITVFSPIPIISLLGCGICGFAVGQMWPGVYSYASEVFPRGGTAMFALLAFAGDMGCASSPTIVGYISTWIQNLGGSFTEILFVDGDLKNVGLRTGMLVATIFPVVMLCTVIFLNKRTRNKSLK